MSGLENVSKSLSRNRSSSLLPLHRGLKRACGVLAEEIQAENCQNDTAYKLKQELVPVDKLGHEAQPETRKQTIDKVAQSGSHACKETGPAPLPRVRWIRACL